jgi:hypothetical protein
MQYHLPASLCRHVITIIRQSLISHRPILGLSLKNRCHCSILLLFLLLATHLTSLLTSHLHPQPHRAARIVRTRRRRPNIPHPSFHLCGPLGSPLLADIGPPKPTAPTANPYAYLRHCHSLAPLVPYCLSQTTNSQLVLSHLLLPPSRIPSCFSLEPHCDNQLNHPRS